MTSPAGAFLEQMAKASRERARALAARMSPATLERRALAAAPPPALTLSRLGFDLLAEVKFASPSNGRLATASGTGAAVERAGLYASAGAAAISVLTEPTRFAGDLAHLQAAARTVRVPVLRKDFLVDPLQVLEARAAGAGGVLLILRLLDDETLASLLDTARSCGLFTLLEAFDARDLERAGRVLEDRPQAARNAPILVGVNARDLETLAVDRERLLALAPSLPQGAVCVAESGIESVADTRAVAAAGYRLALVGSALMRAREPASAARELLSAGRAAAPAPGGAGMVRVKICGLCDEVSLEAACAAGADAVGFVLAPSPRQVSLARARDLLRWVPRGIERVAVFARATYAELAAARDLGFDVLQAEPDSEWPPLPPGTFALPTLRDGPDLLARAQGLPYPDRMHGASLRGALLLEGPGGGGLGTSGDDARARAVARIRPIVLAGGLSPQNVGARIRAVQPFAVDASSGIEHVRGQKDPTLIRAFLRAVRARRPDHPGGLK